VSERIPAFAGTLGGALPVAQNPWSGALRWGLKKLPLRRSLMELSTGGAAPKRGFTVGRPATPEFPRLDP